MSKALATFERRYRAFIAGASLDAAELFQLQALAYDVFRQGDDEERRLLSYVLSTVLKDLAEHLDAEPGSPMDAKFFSKALAGPIDSAIAALSRPLASAEAVRLAIDLLDGRQTFRS